LAIHNSISNITHCPTIDRFIINEINPLVKKSVSAFKTKAIIRHNTRLSSNVAKYLANE